MKEWFTIDQIDQVTYVLSEYRHWEETHAYLLNGETASLLIDTGLGIASIYEEVIKRTDKPVIAVATHVHWDHIGGHREFSHLCVHEAEVSWLTKQFPLPLSQVKQTVMAHCDLPENFDIDRYELFQGAVETVLKDNDVIDLGGRVLRVIHTPGHSPGHMCFYEEQKGYLFTGDLVYQGTLYANYPTTDPSAYLSSLEKISTIPVTRVFPGHHALTIQPELITRMRDALFALDQSGKLHHGSGTYSYGDWSLSL